jgi:hypothetical protein
MLFRRDEQNHFLIDTTLAQDLHEQRSKREYRGRDRQSYGHQSHARPRPLRPAGSGRTPPLSHSQAGGHFVPGFVDRRPAILVCDPNDLLGRPGYFVLLNWEKDRIVGIRDFRFAHYATERAELIAWVD